MGLFGKKKQTAAQRNTSANPTPAESPLTSGATIDLGAVLNDEEIRILATNLGIIENQSTGDNKMVTMAVRELVERKGKVVPQVLPLCIAAVENGMGTFAAFGLVPAGTAELLEKLKKLKEESDNA